jgi:hypothetical protein
MIDLIVLYLGAALTALWGIWHLFPTKSAVEGFGEISLDNKRFITMEWIVEGTALIFMGLLVATVTFVDPVSLVTKSVCIITALGLVALAVSEASSRWGYTLAGWKGGSTCPQLLHGRDCW